MGRIKGFDGLRGLAVVMVTLTHLGVKNFLDKNSFFYQHFNLINGSTFVQLFFVLSGFLITQVVVKNYYIGNKFYFKFFLLNRFLRLAPVVLVFSSILFLLELFEILPQNYIGLFLSLFSLNNLLPFRYYDIYIGHMWSLSVEDQFYLIFALILRYFNNYLYQILIIILVACFIFIIYINKIYSISFLVNSKTYKLSSIFFLDRWFIPSVYSIICGVLISLKSKLLLKFILKWKIKWALFYISLFLFFSEVLFSFNDEFVFHLFKTFSFCLLIIFIYGFQNSFLVYILELRGIKFLGKISYGLYIYQGIFISTSNYMVKNNFQKMPLNLILLLTFSILSFYYVENYFLRFKVKI